MKSSKVMNLGIVLSVLGIGLVQAGVDSYLAKNVQFLSADTLNTVLPLAALVLVVVGFLIGIVGLFLRD